MDVPREADWAAAGHWVFAGGGKNSLQSRNVKRRCRARCARRPRAGGPLISTSFGDLATPNTQWVLSYGIGAYAVKAVESFQPLFHLLNGDLCYADLNPTCSPRCGGTS